LPTSRKNLANGRPCRRITIWPAAWATAALIAYSVGCHSPWTHAPGARLANLPQETWARIAARRTEFPAELADPQWIAAVDSSLPNGELPPYRWRHVGLETLTARATQDRPDLHVALFAHDPVVAANAAIALARDGDEQAAARLVEIATDESLDVEQRFAACETLGSTDYPWVAADLDVLLEEHTRRSQRDDVGYNPEFHAELLRAAAPHAGKIDRRWFLAALAGRHVNVRRAAVESCPADGNSQQLATLTQLLHDDPDPRVRGAAVRAAARSGAALETIEAALTDFDWDVRVAAIGALGEIGSPAAIARLEALLETAPDQARGHVARALAAGGALETVLALSTDSSWQVRLAVAEALAHPTIASRPHRQAVNVVTRLLTDRSAQVQWATVEALSRWPLEAAGPLLLLAIDQSGYRVRKAAADQLAALWEPAGRFPGERFPTEASAQRRGEAQSRLRDQWAAEFGILDHQALAGAAEKNKGASNISEERILRVIELIEAVGTAATATARSQSLEELARSGDDLPEALDQARRRGANVPEAVYREVLARDDPVFAAIDALTDRDPARRRTAAGRLAELGDGQPWPRLALVRLVDVVLAESDSVVWRGVLAAIAGQGGPESNLIAYAAIGHGAADVRRRACEHLAAWPDPRHEAVLLPALGDDQSEVVIAAAAALARQGASSEPRALEKLLASRDPGVRLEAARALARHGQESGRAALLRMAQDADPAVRLRVAEIAGELGEPSLLHALIAMLDDRQGVRLAALTALPRVAGADPTEQAGDSPSTLQRVARWKAWYQATKPSGETLQ